MYWSSGIMLTAGLELGASNARKVHLINVSSSFFYDKKTFFRCTILSLYVSHREIIE